MEKSTGSDGGPPMWCQFPPFPVLPWAGTKAVMITFHTTKELCLYCWQGVFEGYSRVPVEVSVREHLVELVILMGNKPTILMEDLLDSGIWPELETVWDTFVSLWLTWMSQIQSVLWSCSVSVHCWVEREWVRDTGNEWERKWVYMWLNRIDFHRIQIVNRWMLLYLMVVNKS